MENLKEKALGFDNILLLPAEKSNISSRKEVDTTTKISKNVTLKYPIISAPMDTISNVDTCIALNKIGAAGILHRFMPIEKQVEKAIKIKKESGRCYVAIGLKDYQERICKLLNNVDVDLFVLDTANINTPLVEKFLYWYNIEKQKRIMPDLMIGNTLTKESVERAFNLGADSVRHSIGTGAGCITTDMTGIGCPPITALYYGWLGMENYSERSLILDGGIKNPADLVKSIVCGANAIMCGSIFAGCKETTGTVYTKIIYNKYSTVEYQKYKIFRGMASYEVQKEYSLWDGTAENLFVEGKEIEVPCTNESVTGVVYKYVNGLRSALSYLGFSSLQEAKGSLWTGETRAVRV